MNAVVWGAALLAGLGLLQCVASLLAARLFARQETSAPSATPPVTILKPLHGDEPLLQEALASYCTLDYPSYQIVFGVQDAGDPALQVVERLRRRFPARDIAVVIDPARHGANGKIGNLINMLPSAKHDVLVIADSDLHVRPDYLTRLVATLEPPGVGLVTTLYTGLPSRRGLPQLLGVSHINDGFLHGALTARMLGRQDCLGATMMLRRETLRRIGGLEALVDHLADDNVLGRLVREQGLAVALADTVPATTVPENTFAALWRHELRWFRTIRALVPVAFLGSALQFPLAWSAIAAAASGASSRGWALFLVCWAVRAGCARGIRGLLRPRLGGLAFDAPLWLLPLRDLMSLAMMVASYGSRRVEWRGHALVADDGVTGMPVKPETAYPAPAYVPYQPAAYGSTAFASDEGLLPR